MKDAVAMYRKLDSTKWLPTARTRLQERMYMELEL